MNGIFFYIGLGAGLAAACGLRPFLPLLLAGALALRRARSASSFAHGRFHFLQADWWLLVVAVAFVLAYALQLLLGSRRRSTPATRERAPRAARGGARGPRLRRRRGAVRGTLAAHGDAWWPGCSAASRSSGSPSARSRPVIARARARLPDRAAREALTVYLDAASLRARGARRAAAPARLRGASRCSPGCCCARRSRGEEKYAGLRILRR